MAEKAKIIPFLFIEIVHVPTHFAKFLTKYPNSQKEKKISLLFVHVLQKT